MKNFLLIGAISLIVGLVTGYFVKYCPKCEECVECPPVKTEYIERVEYIIEHEKKLIKKETNEAVHKILTDSNIPHNDSIWRAYANKYIK